MTLGVGRGVRATEGVGSCCFSSTGRSFSHGLQGGSLLAEVRERWSFETKLRPSWVALVEF